MLRTTRFLSGAIDVSAPTGPHYDRPPHPPHRHPARPPAHAAEVEVGERHETFRAGVSAGAVGNWVPSAGVTGSAKVGWVGFPEFEVVISPTVHLAPQPWLAHLELWTGWSAKIGKRRMSLNFAGWMMPGGSGSGGRPILPFGFTAGVGWDSAPGKTRYDAFVGAQVTTWGDFRWYLPRVRLHWYPGSTGFLGVDAGPAQYVVQFGWRRLRRAEP